MAKLKKVTASLAAPSSPDDYKPRMYVNLEGSDTSQVEGLKVGDPVELRVTGKVVGLSQNSRTGDNGKARDSGSIDLEDYKVEVVGEEDNEFADEDD